VYPQWSVFAQVSTAVVFNATVIGIVLLIFYALKNIFFVTRPGV
jgi:hypothetical protein